MDPAEFRSLVAGDPSAVRLDRAAIAIAGALRAGVDEAELLAELDRLAAGCPEPTIDGLVHHLFTVEGFEPNTDDYYDWRNSCLDHVLSERTGIPITLSVVTIEVGRRLGLRLVGVGMPTHFLVGCSDDPELFVDAFARGERLDRAGARERFTELTGGQMQWDDSHLDPTPARAIVIRMLNNLRAVFGEQRDAVRLAIVTGLRMAIPELEHEHEQARRALAPLN